MFTRGQVLANIIGMVFCTGLPALETNAQHLSWAIPLPGETYSFDNGLYEHPAGHVVCLVPTGGGFTPDNATIAGYDWQGAPMGETHLSVGRFLRPVQNGYTLAGGFSGSVNIGGQEVHGGASASEFFLARFDSVGQLLWVTPSVSTEQNAPIPMDVASNPAGYTVMLIMGSREFYFGEDTVVSSSGYSWHVLFIDPTGDLLWARSFVPTQSGEVFGLSGTSIAIDADNRVWLASELRFAVSVDTDTITPIEENASDHLVLRFDEAGNNLTSHLFPGTQGTTDLYCTELVPDATGTMYWLGAHEGTVALGEDTLASAGGFDGLIMHLDGTLSPDHALSIRSVVDDVISVGTYDPIEDRLLVAGVCGPEAVFGNDTIQVPEGKGMFLSEISTQGIAGSSELLALMPAGNANYIELLHLVVNDGPIHISGRTWGSSTFVNGSSFGESNFLARIDRDDAVWIREGDTTMTSSLICWPIPTSSELYVNWSKATGGPIRFEVYTVNGALAMNGLSHRSASTELTSINVASLQPGVYHLRLYSSDMTETLEFVKMQ